ncbi:MAG: WD40 repeat domain-containing protein, partial [Chloroflexi bacterium]|nr:WD40 repeat domain-containing protein [Chloroflexota bacterium]
MKMRFLLTAVFLFTIIVLSNTAPAPALEGTGGFIRAVAYNTGGDLFAYGTQGGDIFICRAQDGKEINHMEGHSSWITALVFSPDGKNLYSSSADQTVRGWSTDTGKQFLMLPAGERKVTSIALSPDGKLLAASSEDRTIRLWKLPSGTPVVSTVLFDNDTTDLSFSPDGKLLACSSEDETVRIFSTDNFKVKTRMDLGQIVDSVVFITPSRLAAGLEDGTVQIIEEDQIVSTNRDGNLIIADLTASPDGKLLAAACQDDCILLMDSGTGKLIRRYDEFKDGVNSVSFAPDNRHLAGAGEDGTVRIFETNSPDSIIRISLAPGSENKDYISAVSYSHDGSLAAVGARDKKIHLFNRAGELIAVLEGHNANVSTVAFSPEGKFMISGAQDGAVRIWNLQERSVEEFRPVECVITQVGFFPSE